MATSEAIQTKDLNQTPLFALHQQLGGRLVDFAGYQLPVQYEGILAEHQHTRGQASLFDVSHMGQAELSASAEALEKIFPSDLVSMKQGQQRYTFLLNEQGGIIDDLMIVRLEEKRWHIVVNGACKEKDYAHLRAHLTGESTLLIKENCALLALQGPEAKNLIGEMNRELAALPFMSAAKATLDVGGASVPVFISRSGYTGEDGYEISLNADHAETLAVQLLKDERTKPAGLGARDTLRLEAGLCLYGQDIDETTSPLEAGLGWAMQKRRKTEGGFIGEARIFKERKQGVKRKRIGLRVQEKRPVRPPSILLDEAGNEIGHITSGGVAATQTHPIAMGYIQTAFAKPDTALTAEQRGKKIPTQIVTLPFRPHNYFNQEKK